MSQLEEDIASHREAYHSDKKALISAHEKKADDTELFHDQQKELDWYQMQYLQAAAVVEGQQEAMDALYQESRGELRMAKEAMSLASARYDEVESRARESQCRFAELEKFCEEKRIKRRHVV